MKLGTYIYGLATIAAGILDLIWREFEPAHQPIEAFGDAIAHQHVLAYIGAIWLIFAGVAILWRPTARVGAAASAAIYLLFAIFWLPRFVSATHAFGFSLVVCIGVLGGVAQQAILVAAGAIVIHGPVAPEDTLRPRAGFSVSAQSISESTISPECT